MLATSNKVRTILAASLMLVASSAWSWQPPSLSGLNPFKNYQPMVVVSDPYIEMHTGPGRGYPIFYVAGQGDEVQILKQRTDWFKIKGPRDKEGWVHIDQMRHDRRAHQGSRDEHGRKYEHRPEDLHAEVTAQALEEAALGSNAPGVVERLLDLLHDPRDGVEQKCESEDAEAAHVDALDHVEQLIAELDASFTERLEIAHQGGLQVVMHAESLEQCEAERQHGHQGQQRRVHEARGTHVDLTVDDLANDHVADAKGPYRGRAGG